MKTTINGHHQLEIGFTHESFSVQPVIRRPRVRRMTRAHWWFRRMHNVVNQALDWSPAASPRPEQTYLALSQAKQV